MPLPPAPAATDIPGSTAVLYCNLGTPDAPTAPAVRRYLAEFLSDPRVVEIPRLAWWPILHGIILRVRPAKSAAKYASIWTDQGSALKVWTAAQTLGLRGALAGRGHRVGVHYAMRYGQPAIAAQLDALAAQGVTRILVLQAYPQYSGTTTASVLDAVGDWSRRQRRVPDFRFVGDYHGDAGYIAALADSVERHWAQHGRGELLLMSFHGIPARNIALGDPYHAQCQATARLLAQRLGLGSAQYRVTFQSRFGRAKWLEPYTEPTLRALAQQGTRRIDVMCPGFPSDCLETLEEINMEAREAFLESGGEAFSYIPCLNDSPAWAAALADLAERHLTGWNTRTGEADQPAVS
ncbi:ferrochelatase [Pseudorhodoferax sp. Leaf274]|uniref:ferrochelatase n=1 Tax=Pseudorhodoferax sp. Leaf274 TaxID=1736318 RepID=UPI0007026F74|nr:ferrochelatase [Pseudorhodoferax sp. Leaf274]KQP49286.1 ferrochelatase [Pseudorhodoferax sp. Leaf274]